MNPLPQELLAGAFLATAPSAEIRDRDTKLRSGGPSAQIRNRDTELLSGFFLEQPTALPK